jgi:hypothetical protein
MDVLDQTVLGEQGLPLALTLDGLKVADRVEHRLFLVAEVGRGNEVGRDAVGEDRGLADVDHAAFPVLHQIDARNAGKSPGFDEQVGEAV